MNGFRQSFITHTLHPKGERKMIRTSLVMVVLSFAVLAAGVSFAAEDLAAKEKAAFTAAQGWLKLIDGGKFDASWREAAGFMKGKVTREQWFQMMETNRKPLGTSSSRTKTSTWFKTTMPGAPDGEYYIFQFESVLSDKKTYVETVTPTKEKDGKWRVIGYYIKPKDENKDKVTTPAVPFR